MSMSLNKLVGIGSNWQVVDFEVETSLVRVSQEILLNCDRV